jgi:MFS family permease
MSAVQQDTQQPYSGKPRRVAPLWGNRDFLLLVGGQGVSSVGTAVSQLAFPLLALAVTHSPAQAGLMAALRGLPFALFCLPAGALVDRWNRKLVMILCDTGRAIALGSIPVAMIFGHLTIIQLYSMSLMEGILFVFFNMAEAAALPHVVAKEQLTAAIGQDQVLYSSAMMIGPSLGGFLYGLSRMLPFLSDAISYAISVISLFFIRTQFQEEREEQKEQAAAGAKVSSLWGEVKDVQRVSAARHYPSTSAVSRRVTNCGRSNVKGLRHAYYVQDDRVRTCT